MTEFLQHLATFRVKIAHMFIMRKLDYGSCVSQPLVDAGEKPSQVCIEAAIVFTSPVESRCSVALYWLIAWRVFKKSGAAETPSHKVNHRRIQHGFGGGRSKLVVLAQTAETRAKAPASLSRSSAHTRLRPAFPAGYTCAVAPSSASAAAARRVSTPYHSSHLDSFVLSPSFHFIRLYLSFQTAS